MYLRYCCLKFGWYYHLSSGLQRAKGLYCQWKTKRMFSFFKNSLKSDWITSVEAFKCFFCCCCLTFPISVKLKNSIVEIPITRNILNINNYRATSSSSNNLNISIIKKVIKYYFKNFVWRQCFHLPFLRSCCLKVGRYY